MKNSNDWNSRTPNNYRQLDWKDERCLKQASFLSFFSSFKKLLAFPATVFKMKHDIFTTLTRFNLEKIRFPTRMMNIVLIVLLLMGSLMVFIMPSKSLTVKAKPSTGAINITSGSYHPNDPKISDTLKTPLPFRSQQETVKGMDDALRDSIISFLQRSQDDGQFLIKSMDDAYYRALSLSFLTHLGGNVEADARSALETEILAFVNESRNENGGYGNWKGAPSSMESTYQAFQIMKALDALDQLTEEKINSTLTFVKSLETVTGGFYPLPDWDAPDITSTFRAAWIYQLINETHPQLSDRATLNVTRTLSFMKQLSTQARSVAGEQGFSEIIGGQIDILSTYYAMQTFFILERKDIARDYAVNVTNFLKIVSHSNGGITNKPTNLPTTGYTSVGIQLYLLLTKLTNVSSILPQDYLENAINYLKANKKAGSGFSASNRDKTPELASTFAALRAFDALHASNMLDLTSIDLTGVFTFINRGKDPTFGFGNYPGDATTVERTAQALLVGALLGNLSWIHPKVADFLKASFDATKGGFGFRPGAKALIKYTYHAIRAARVLGLPLPSVSDIVLFLAKSQNDDGGFGQDPRAKLSYLTHTYWALRTLTLLKTNFTQDTSFNFTALEEFTHSLRYADGTYGNFFGWERTLTSTYKGVMVTLLMGKYNASEDPLRQVLLGYFQDAERGGFRPRFTSRDPTMQATYYGVTLARLLNITLNVTKIREFVLSLHNDDGGFAPRPQFSSRVSATYHAVMILKMLDEMERATPINDTQFWTEITLDEVAADLYAPIIEPTYIPSLDTNKSIIGSYVLMAKIVDVESSLEEAWVEIKWFNEKGELQEEVANDGMRDKENPTFWSFVIGPFTREGYLLVRIHGIDTNGNEGFSDWLSFRTLGSIQTENTFFIDVTNLIITLVIPLTLVVALSDDLLSYRRKKKMILGDVKMEIPVGKQQSTGIVNSLTNNLNILYLVVLMSLISIISRLFLKQAILVLDQSTFLFRFLLGALVILSARYIVGMRTFGFFAPMVLVISWLQIGPLWASSAFMFIFFVAYQARKLIEPFNLAYGFRIAILMVISVTTLALLEILGESFRIASLSTSILLPIIITPNMVDRYVRDALETNEAESFLTLMKTLFIVAVAYVIMSFDPLVRFIVLNPETWILVLLVMVYLGRTRRHVQKEKKRFQRIYKKGEEPLTLLVRNRDYIARYNHSVLFPIINKFDMKEQFDKWHVPTAELHAVVADEDALPELMERLLNEDKFIKGFVIKPARSFGGKGIVVVERRTDDGYFVIDGERYHPQAIETHIRRILQGEFMTSMTRTDQDIALIEEKIVVHPDLGKISLGLPDIRVIVFRGIPVMCMARLPTKESRGKANLKQGAIGAAISVSKGIIFRAEKKGIALTKHPDTKNEIVGHVFQQWQEILAVACLAQKSSGLGYAGVDIVIDEQNRILVLEVNKRPGLEIQNVNGSSLLERFRFIEEHDLEATNLSPIRAARMGMELARDHWERELQDDLPPTSVEK